MGRLDGRVAIITGAGGGIGRAATKLFVEEGASVFLTDRNEADLEAAADGLDPHRVGLMVADASDPGQVESFVASAVERFAGLDIAILNAGVAGVRMPIEDYPIDLFDEVVGINLRGAWLGLRAAIPHMKRRGRGSVVVTSSVQGLAALAGTTAYTTSKHGLVGMVKGAALELAAHNVRVNAIHPGYIDTPMMDGIHKAAAPDAPDAVHEAIAKSVPAGRYATPEEIARMMLFLASDDSSYSTGASFIADGGLLASLPPV
ncbi:MAG TPA: SDR family NAD(P)-dependent oxidoreductase [Alphaproteobacteria bacterium]|nr:SDR family NAD(P)-dependent oxidoreductase [Alphaproteobacteria bacterium]